MGPRARCWHSDEKACPASGPYRPLEVVSKRALLVLLVMAGITVKPSILHGDLWSGNVSGVNGEPGPSQVPLTGIAYTSTYRRLRIFDPACYYGHHEAEWGMSWCARYAAPREEKVCSSWIGCAPEGLDHTRCLCIL
eukprot:8096057-Pyramimonas_sp.AAC.1